MIQKFDPGISSAAAGKAMKASPLELVLAATGDYCPFRYPTTEKTANPAKKERMQLPKEITMTSLMMGLFLLL
jgi:hypothetical protein